MGRIFSHLKVQQRWTIEKLLNENCSITYIAKVIKVNKSTVSREIKRGTITIFTSNLRERNIYDALAGERIYKENRKNSFNKPKFKNNYLLMNSIENKIINDKFSPRAASYYIHDSLNIRISYSTIYRYIKHKYFKSITMKKLPYGNLIKYKKLYREQKRYNAGVNIFYRDSIVNNRSRFGDWEMDCVEGKKYLSNKVVLNLTERRTRASLFYILNNHTNKEVIKVFNNLEDIFKDDFSNVFKTITTDNGREFISVDQIEKSKYSNNKRTNVFYCDAYKPYQKGTVENQNRLLRRFIKKGTNFDQLTQLNLDEIKQWINNYNRKILNGKSSYMALKSEFKNNNIDKKYLKLFI